MQQQDKYYTDLDLDLQRLAAVDWERFVQIVGEDAILSAKICLLRSRGKSQAQIAYRLNVGKHIAQYHSEKCKGKPCDK
jgi:hypothetical protein